MALLSYNPPVLDLVVYAGDDTNIPMTITSAGDPVDITGTHFAQVRLTRDGDLMGTMIVDPTNLSNGQVTLKISSELSEVLIALEETETKTDYFGNDLITAPMWEGVWDWNYTVGNITRTLVQGKITVIKDVTR